MFPYRSIPEPSLVPRVVALKFFPLRPNSLFIKDERIGVFAYPYVGLAAAGVVFGSSPNMSLSNEERAIFCFSFKLPLLFK